jgi:AraC family transcriptional regulator, regulatory protein of adaptative response / methylated-DNA-[protein]-cysteine methyltransferase
VSYSQNGQGGALTQADPEVRWQAVIDRDPGSDGRFFYGVSSTGIYCRPTCPARRPQRAHVRFFDTPDEAEAAGYRACRRCEPKSGQPATTRRVTAVREYLDNHPDETVTLERLSRVANMSPYHLQRTFKKVVGVSPKAYASARRLERMKSRLRTGVTVSRATFDAGYASGSRAYEHARNGMGMTPGSYRNGGRGMTISHTVLPTPVGHLLLAATERGVCSVMLGDSASELETALRREYPAATIQAGNGELKHYTEAVLQQIQGKEGQPLPLDVGGTAFQRQVWEALRRIPPGETRSYRTIARELGRPSSARAVARACATNRVAVVIPCHRAVSQSGKLGGYRWGIDRKQRLLDREREGARTSTIAE